MQVWLRRCHQTHADPFVEHRQVLDNSQLCATEFRTSRLAQKTVGHPPSTARAFPDHLIVRLLISEHRPNFGLRQYFVIAEKTPVFLPVLRRLPLSQFLLQPNDSTLRLCWWLDVEQCRDRRRNIDLMYYIH